MTGILITIAVWAYRLDQVIVFRVTQLHVWSEGEAREKQEVLSAKKTPLPSVPLPGSCLYHRDPATVAQ